MNRVFLRLIAPAFLALSVLPAQPVEAVPFLLTADLTGDFRAENPDNLLVHVTVSGDTTSNLTQWTIDLDSPLYPNLTLGGFFFNLANPAGTSLTFSNFSPTLWSITASSSNAQGSGGALFEFEAQDPPGGTNNVTNSTSLTFTAMLNGGLWDPSMLLLAPLSTGGGIPDPGAQMGAHLRSAIAPCSSGCTDSGFASGSFQPPTSVPEPTTLLLSGLGLIGAAMARRRRA
jgi:PEP-CTERM motif